MSSNQEPQKEDLEEAQEICGTEEESSTADQKTENKEEISNVRTEGTDQCVNEENNSAQASISETKHEQLDEVSSQRTLIPSSENLATQNEPIENYQVMKGVLEVEVHSSAEDERKDKASTSENLKPTSEKKISGQGDTKLVIESTGNSPASAHVAKTTAPENISDTYDVITKREMQHTDDWENVNKSCLSEIPPIDPGALYELERRATDVAGNLDHLMGTLATSLKSMSVIGLRTVDAYGTCVEHVGESVEASIKSMYTLIAKCEQLDASMTPLYRMAGQIKDIKRSLDVFESVCK